MIHVGIYPRKSKKDERSDSMEVQISMCIDFLDRKYGKNNYYAHIYDGDYGITAHSTKNRLDFQRMMRDMVSIPLSLIVIQRYDRIARNTRDFCNIYHDMQQANCDLVSVSQNIDTSTPYGRKFMYDQASMAEMEWELNSERRKDAYNYCVKIGKYVGSNSSVPFGYKPGIVDGIRRLVKDPDTGPILMEIIDLYEKYRNYSKCAKYVNDMYGYTKEVNFIKKIIRNTVYYGSFKGNDNYCEPYISFEKWQNLQRKVPVVRYDNYKTDEILFSGLLRCPACRRKMRAQTKTTHSGNKYRYYHCEYHSTNICDFRKVKSELLIEEMLLNNIESYVFEEQSLIHFEEQKKKLLDVERFRSELSRLNMMYQKGRIDEAYYDSEYIRLSDLIRANEVMSDQSDKIKRIDSVFRGDWRDLYEKLDKMHRKIFWRDLLEEVVLDDEMRVIGVIFL